jgi:hypothetical protein
VNKKSTNYIFLIHEIIPKKETLKEILAYTLTAVFVIHLIKIRVVFYFIDHYSFCPLDVRVKSGQSAEAVITSVYALH